MASQGQPVGKAQALKRLRSTAFLSDAEPPVKQSSKPNWVQMEVMKDCRKLWGKLQDERAQSNSQVSTVEDLSFMRWLKQWSDQYDQMGQQQKPEEMQIKRPEDRKKLYDWLKFYHSHIVEDKPVPGAARSSNE